MKIRRIGENKYEIEVAGAPARFYRKMGLYVWEKVPPEEADWYSSCYAYDEEKLERLEPIIEKLPPEERAEWPRTGWLLLLLSEISVPLDVARKVVRCGGVATVGRATYIFVERGSRYSGKWLGTFVRFFDWLRGAGLLEGPVDLPLDMKLYAGAEEWVAWLLEDIVAGAIKFEDLPKEEVTRERAFAWWAARKLKE